MKVKDCSKCRKDILKAARDEYIKSQYAILQDCAFTFAIYATVGTLTAMVRRGRSKEYIQKLFDDIVMIYDTPQLFGKDISVGDLKRSLEKEYGIDFNRINVHIEDEKAFIKSLNEGEKNGTNIT